MPSTSHIRLLITFSLPYMTDLFAQTGKLHKIQGASVDKNTATETQTLKLAPARRISQLIHVLALGCLLRVRAVPLDGGAKPLLVLESLGPRSLDPSYSGPDTNLIPGKSSKNRPGRPESPGNPRIPPQESPGASRRRFLEGLFRDS